MSEQNSSEARQPQFYQSPEPLDARKHGDLKFRNDTGYGFARTATGVMITAAEFVHAAKHYPIVFTEANQAVPIALMGVRSGENLFVDADGNWKEGVYIPAYIRRYPFAFVSSTDADRLILCVDRDSQHVSEEDGEPLFVDGEATAVTNSALEFCTAFQRQHNVTQQLCEALKEHGLLSKRRADVSLGPIEKTAVTDFLAATEDALAGLEDDSFLDLRRRGLLGFLYVHLMSLTNFNTLAQMAVQVDSDAAA